MVLNINYFILLTFKVAVLAWLEAQQVFIQQ